MLSRVVVAMLVASVAAGIASIYAAGRVAGRVEIEARLAADGDARQRAAEAAFAQTRARVVELEGERDELQTALRRFDVLASRDRSGARPCLDTRLVRALDAIGRDRNARGARPRP